MVKRNEHCEQTGCPIACALDILGDHWTLLIIRALMFMNLHEYKEFLAMEERISSNILSDRLKKLEDEDIIASAPHPETKRRKLYYLTDKGKGLIYVMLDLIRWSEKYLDDRVYIPPEKRAFIDSSPEKVIQMVFSHLEKWEKEFLRHK